MDDPTAPIARRAAARLAGSLDPNLPALTERVLVEQAPSERTRFDAGVSIALAGLLLSAVQLGWQVYRDLKEDREKREKEEQEKGDRRIREVLVRRMRLELGEPRGLTIEQRDRLLEVVAEEILVTEESPD